MSIMQRSRPVNRLDGRVALISGGAQGIGRGIATVFQREGACVFILDCDARKGNETATDLTAENPNLPVKYLAADLREPLEIQMAVDSVRKFQSRVDILVNNAGIELDKPLERITAA